MSAPSTALPVPESVPAAQPAGNLPAGNLTAGHYSITYPEGFSGVEPVAAYFNASWNAFNEVFRFEPATNGPSCRVLIIAEKDAFDAYIRARIGETRNGCIFLKYARPELSELVILGPPVPGPALNRQLFLQYLYSFVSEPPVWVRDGFQAWFEQLVPDTTSGVLVRESSSAWLETAKNLHSDPSRKLDVSEILAAETGSVEASRLYPQAWAFAAFLLSTENPEYQRFLYESCILLKGEAAVNTATQKENTARIAERFTRFYSAEKTDTDFSAWLSGQKTFNELLQEGVTAYNGGKYPPSRAALLKAEQIRSDDPLLVYYLGLVSYAEKKYREADEWYKKALAYGGESSTVNWALGLNAAADKRYAEARTYLEAARTANPARYGEKAAKMISSLPK
jgi:hypothetical protein